MSATPTPEQLLQYAIDRNAIVQAVNDLAYHVDRRDWAAARAYFADEVWYDYEQLVGREPGLMEADALINAWSLALGKLTATQYHITNHRVTVEGDTAQCTSYMHAMHYWPNPDGPDHWMLYGHYEHTLRRDGLEWKITHLKLNVTFQSGEIQLMALAAAPLAG